ncbi:alpha/beta fold hydrolase [Asticcacaulis sp. AC402]|uniref:alpha/beta fold hydrolase n=1 Tax=Asticcacaulis sp. AC402 TaxID=1282361 RepID=UPI0003FC63CA|nr:alpha/beta fold hydrolase [Asticcacaulis sp. AC402]
MQRHLFNHDGLRFSYLDSGGEAPVLLLLHARGMQASDFNSVAGRFAPGWRVVALDQRGHGETSPAQNVKPQDYVGDVGALLDHLSIARPVALLGHSLGGEIASRFAAAHPKRVRALIIEDMIVRHQHDYALDWEESLKAWLATSLPALVLRAGKRPVVQGEDVKERVRRRPNTLLVTIDSGQSIHIDKPDAFVATVLDFLGRLTGYEASLLVDDAA